jgi:hypothetical protein
MRFGEGKMALQIPMLQNKDRKRRGRTKNQGACDRHDGKSYHRPAKPRTV